MIVNFVHEFYAKNVRQAHSQAPAVAAGAERRRR
jgi:hypothetical protein